MTRTSRVVLGISGTLITVLVVALFFFRHLLVQSFPATSGTVTVAGTGAPVEVYRDGYGIPHISAENTPDLMFVITSYSIHYTKLYEGPPPPA